MRTSPAQIIHVRIRGDGLKTEGQRQKQRDRDSGPDSGQYADERAQRDPDRSEEQVFGLERDREAAKQVLEAHYAGALEDLVQETRRREPDLQHFGEE